LGGGLVKRAWFRHYAASALPQQFERIVQSWDTANKATELSDYSVCTTWGIKGKNLYLLSVLRKRLEYPDLKRAAREQQRLFNANVVLIEDMASGTQLIQELIVDGCYAVKSYKPECDKPHPGSPNICMRWRSSQRASTTTRSTRPPSSLTGSKSL
jgi:phage terminase large subunit-like protein